MALTERQQARKRWLEMAIQAIQSANLAALKSGASSYGISDRNLERFSPSELEKLCRQYENELSILEKKEAGKYTRTVRVYG